MPRWLVFSLLAVGLWGVWGVINAPAGQALEPLPLQVFSTLGLAAVAFPLLASRRAREGKEFGRGFAFAFATGLCGSLGNVALSASLRMGGEVAIVLPLTSVYPLVTVILARVILKERLNRVQHLGFALALAALVVSGIVGAGGSKVAAGPWWEKAFSPWMRYALATLVLFGLAAVFQKLATNRISNELSMVGFAAAFVAIAGVIVAFSGSWAWGIPRQAWVLALSYGALIGAGTLALFAAYRRGKAAVVTAVTALYPALTVVLAVPILGERLDALKVAMILLSLGAGVALTFEGRPAETGLDSTRPAL